MKKNILLILTFIISFILLIDSAEAAKELTCIYTKYKTDGGSVTISRSYEITKALTQDSNGNIKFYTTIGEGRPFTAGYNMENNEVKKPSELDYADIKIYDKKSKTLTACPPCIKRKYGVTTDGEYEPYDDVFVFSEYSDEKTKSCEGISGGWYVALEQQVEEVPNEQDFSCRDITVEEAQEDIKNTDYTHICEYVSSSEKNFGGHTLKIYYNQDKYTVLGSNTIHSCIKLSDIINYKKGVCPRYIYSTYDATKIYMDSAGGNIFKMQLVSVDDVVEEEPKVEINNCGDLFGPDLVKEINKVMNIIRIAVPILLIIFGIVDFFKATFDNNEDEMKKDRERFIKRIIAAIIVFLVPIFVNLVLDVANTVWSDINSDTCISTTE